MGHLAEAKWWLDRMANRAQVSRDRIHKLEVALMEVEAALKAVGEKSEASPKYKSAYAATRAFMDRDPADVLKTVSAALDIIHTALEE
jgi:hypothetical protein